jgi:hypothetical protein
LRTSETTEVEFRLPADWQHARFLEPFRAARAMLLP